MFKSADYVSWKYVGAFHSHGGGMWECPDFYKIPGTDAYVHRTVSSHLTSALACSRLLSHALAFPICLLQAYVLCTFVHLCSYYVPAHIP